MLRIERVTAVQRGCVVVRGSKDRGGDRGRRESLDPLAPFRPSPSSTSAMAADKAAGKKKNLLLCFDAFGTLFTPSVPIPIAYARAAKRHGIQCGDTDKAKKVGARFKDSFKSESQKNPNYGKANGLGAEKWWANVRLLCYPSLHLLMHRR